MAIYILGISAYYHDSAVCLLKDGVLISAAQEERFSRIKHDSSFPTNAAIYCLKEAGITIKDVDFVVYYEKPIKKFGRILDECITHAPRGFRRFQKSMKSWLGNKLWISTNIKRALNYDGKVYYSEHHQAHAASTFYSSNFEKATIVTIDGVGEEETVTISIGNQNQIKPLVTLNYPNSPGLFYSAFTQYCGFKVNSGEYKLMGLAPYGEAKYVDLIKNELIKIHDDGTFELNDAYFNYRHGERMVNSRFENLLGQTIRKPETPITQFHKDIAASAQIVLEELVLRIVQQAIQLTKCKHVCLAGGVALNCVANSKLISRVTDSLYVYPASGDAGASVGAAYLIWYDHLKNIRQINQPTLSNTVFLGPKYSDGEHIELLIELGVSFTEYSTSELLKLVAKNLHAKSVIGWFQGRSEFGPRALGNRSILASPIFKDMQSHVNLKIKKREGFRPFAPVTIETAAQKYFDITGDSKFMLTTSNAIDRDLIPSCVHVDASSRLQIIYKNENDLLYNLLKEYAELSEIPILINTSFNLRGEPIVNAPIDALNTFFNCDLDCLVLGNIVINKSDNLSLMNNWKKMSHELD